MIQCTDSQNNRISHLPVANTVVDGTRLGWPLTGLAGVRGQLGLETLSNSSWKEDIEAPPGEGRVLGVGGCDMGGCLLLPPLSPGPRCSSGSDDEADALDAWLPSSSTVGGGASWGRPPPPPTPS